MKRKLTVFFLCFVFSIGLIWGSVFAVDYARCSALKKPVFAMGIDTADDGGSGTYRGLGYEITIDGHLSAEYGFQVDTLDITLLGKPIYHVIACY